MSPVPAGSEGRADPAAEQVLCVGRHLVFPDGAWHGLVTTGLQRVLRVIRAAAEYRPRLHVEDDPTQQQVIPYCIVRHGDGTYLLTRRLRRSSERRLHHLHSLGVGGHVNPGDGIGADPVLGGLAREWREEVICPARARAVLVGILNDDTTAVSAVHLGLVFIVEPDDGVRVSVRETDKLEGDALTLEEMRPLYDTMESWSRLAYDGLVRAQLGQIAHPPLGVELPATG